MENTQKIIELLEVTIKKGGQSGAILKLKAHLARIKDGVLRISTKEARKTEKLRDNH